MVASAGEVHYALHTGSARGAPKLISPAVTEEGGDFGAWLGARCVLIRCAMPLQLRLYGMKVRRLGATTAQQCAGQALAVSAGFCLAANGGTLSGTCCATTAQDLSDASLDNTVTTSQMLYTCRWQTQLLRPGPAWDLYIGATHCFLWPWVVVAAFLLLLSANPEPNPEPNSARMHRSRGRRRQSRGRGR